MCREGTVADTTSDEPGQIIARRILLAEDALVNQKVAITLLEKRGHLVDLAINGKEAVAAVDRKPFDLVLMDVEMPEMDGIEATIAIREKEKTTGNHVPIIAMTAHAMKGDRERFLESGMDGYLAKPFDAIRLYEMVEGIAPTASEPLATREPLPTREGEPQAVPVLDLDDALERIGGHADILRELVEPFLQECTKLTKEIQQAISNENAVQLERAAHTLKSSLLAFCARPAGQAAQNLEALAREKKLAGAKEAWLALETEIARVLPALAEFAKTGDP